MPNLNQYSRQPYSTSTTAPRGTVQHRYTLKDLRNDEEFQKKSERFLTSLGERGTVEDMFEYFRGTDFNIWDAGKLALQSNKFTDEQKQDYNYLRNKFDNADLGSFWEGAKAAADIGWEVVTDPTMFASLFFVPWTGGASAAARVSAQVAARAGLKKLANREITKGAAKGVPNLPGSAQLAGLKKLANRETTESAAKVVSKLPGKTTIETTERRVGLGRLPGQVLETPLSNRAKTTIASTEGFVYGSSHDYVSQEKDLNTDRLEELSLKRSLGMGLAGAALPAGLAGVGLGISKFNRAIKSKRAARIDGGEDYKAGILDKGLQKVDDATDAIMEAVRPTSRALTAFIAKPTSRFISKMKENEQLDTLIKLFRYDTGRSMTGEGYDVAQEVSKRSFYEHVNTYNGDKAELLRKILKGLKTKGTRTIPKIGSRDAFFKFGFTKRGKTAATKQTRGEYYRISDETNEALAYFLRTGRNTVTIDGRYVSLDKAFNLTEHTTKQIVDSGKKIRELLDGIHADAGAVGLKFDKIKHYLPRSFNYYAVKKEIQNLEKGKWGALATEIKNKEKITSRDDILKILRDINDPFSRAGKSHTALATIGKGAILTKAFAKATPSLSKKRKLLNIDEANISEYLDSDISTLLHDYVQQAGAYIQRTKHFGEDLADFQTRFIKPIQDALGEKGKALSVAELNTLERLYLVTTGQMSNFDDGFISATTKRTLSDIVTVTNQMALLPFATITSFAEVAVPLVRGAGKRGVQKGKGFEDLGEGGIRTLWKTAGDYRKMWWNDIVKRDLADARPEALKELNRFNRAVDRAGEDRALAMYGQGFGRRATLIQNKFFKFNLLHDWTRFVQLTSFNVAKSKMYENLFELATNKNIKAKTRLRLENELKELGIENIGAGKRWVKGGGKPSGKFYDNSFLPSAARYVDEVIMNPTAAANQKPLWHSMPSTRWAFGLLGFPTAFSNTVLKNAVREVSKDVRSRQLHSTPGVALGLTSMIGITMFGNTLRSGGKNLEEIEAGDRDISDEVKDAAIRAGLLGPTESIVRTKDTLAYENFITAVTKRFTGPAVDDIINLTKGYEGLLTFAVSKIPGIAILRSTNPEAYKEIRAAAREVDITRRGKKPQEEEVLGRPLIPHYAKGGVVKDVPQVPEEPDERIDKMTGLPYNVQAGKAFIDEEDPEKRERLAIGGPLSRIILKKIRASLQDPILPGPKPGEAPGPRVSKSTTTEVAEEATEEIAEEATEAATSAAGKDVARLQVAEEATEAATSAADKRVWIEEHIEKLALLYLPGAAYFTLREREEALDSISEMPLKEKLEIISDESIKEDLERLLQATEEIEKPPYPEGEDPTAYRWTGEEWVPKSDTGWLGSRIHKPTGTKMTEFTIGNIDNPLDPDDPLRPSMVPTLTEEEIEFLTTLPVGMSPREWGERPLGKSVLEKSWEHYKMRREQGLSPFLTPEEEKEREGYQEGSLVEDPSPAGEDLERLQATEMSLRGRFLPVQRAIEGDHGDIPVPTNDASEKPLAPSQRSLDIGYGHKVTPEEIKTGVIHGITFIDSGGNYIPLDEKQKETIQQQDMREHLALARSSGWDIELKQRGSSWDSLDEAHKLALEDLAYNVGGKKAGNQWKKIFDAIVNQDTEDFVRQLRRQDAGKETAGMDNRVARVAYTLGLINNLKEAHKAGLTLADTTEVPEK